MGASSAVRTAAWISAVHSAFMLSLVVGRKMVIMHKWDAQEALRARIPFWHGAVRAVGEADTRIDHLTKAIDDTPGADAALADDVRALAVDEGRVDEAIVELGALCKLCVGIYIASWPNLRARHWNALLRARAIEIRWH